MSEHAADHLKNDSDRGKGSLEPDERKFVSPERIRVSCLVGSGAEIIEQIEGMERVGLTQVMLLPSLEHQYEALEDVSREVLTKM